MALEPWSKNVMMNKRLVYGLLFLVAGVLLAVVGWRVCFETRKARLYAAGQEAAAAGRWGEAFLAFSALIELAPDSPDARARLDEALGPAIATVPGGSNIAAEVALVRWLAASDDPRLPAVLDRCIVIIPAGEFLMGSTSGPPDEQPQRRVYLDTFALDRYEVANTQYHRFLQATGRLAPPYWTGDAYPRHQADFPVVGVSWQDAADYCTWAGKRLPTEAEWERACRGDAGQTYPWGELWDPQRANVDRTIEHSQATPRAAAWDEAWGRLQATTPAPGNPGLRPVGSYLTGASPYGVLDLVGNAAEWEADLYNWSGYSDLPTRNPLGTGPAWNHVLRGSSWYDPYGEAGRVQEMSRCAARNSAHIAHDPRLGFRCASSGPSMGDR
jgi:formylglycine-generating enzyme required for sulfatase activity